MAPDLRQLQALGHEYARLRSLQARLGHATPNLTLGLYAHVPAEVDRAAASRLEELLAGDQPPTEMGTRRARDAE